MIQYFKKMLLGAAIAALAFPVFEGNIVAAGTSFGFPQGRPYYGATNQHSSCYRTTYRNEEPVTIRSERAPDVVAQAPTERRSYSYEPSQTAESQNNGASSQSGSTAVVTENARRSDGSYRSYSYEPSTESYSAPRMGSSQSHKPAYLLQKTDPNKYRGF
jgi:hypothetical protein